MEAIKGKVEGSAGVRALRVGRESQVALRRLKNEPERRDA
jgi:hypothetical protein